MRSTAAFVVAFFQIFFPVGAGFFEGKAALGVRTPLIESTASQASAANDIPKDLFITLERTLCYGFCPSYKLTISADGSVVFEGREHVKKPGVSKSHLSQVELRQLVAEFEKADFFSLRNRYHEPADGCDAFVTDNPSAITSIRINGKTKTVDHYYGCRGPKAIEVLTRLESRIDEIANTAQWVK